MPGVEAAGDAAGRVRMFSDPTRLLLAAALGEVGEILLLVRGPEGPEQFISEAFLASSP